MQGTSPHTPCRRCGATVELVFRARPDTVHRGELRCPLCNAHVKWVPKESTDTTGKVRKRRPSKRLLGAVPECRQSACNPAIMWR